MVYLDYNATAPMKPAVCAAMVEAMGRMGNPSSVHRFGRVARKYIEDARTKVAALVGVKPTQVIFTSGGTEANNLALRQAEGPVLASAIEHESVLTAAGNGVRLPVTRDGVLDLVAAEEILKTAPCPSLVTLMLVNNETGVVQPVAELARLAKTYGFRVHTDAVQAAGKIPLDFATLGVDSMSLSAHKIGGPQGVGALIVRENANIAPLLCGGGQEMNRRAGTENVPGIIGFGVAAQLAADDLLDAPQIRKWRDELQQKLVEIAGDDAVVVGNAVARVGNTLCLALRGVSGETQVVALDLAGVAVSAGAACSSGKVKSSHVLRAMGYADDVAGSAVRFSLGWNTQSADVLRGVEVWRGFYRRLREKTPSPSLKSTAA